MYQFFTQLQATEDEKLQRVFSRLTSLELLLEEADDKVQEQQTIIAQLSRDNAQQEMAIRKLSAHSDKQLKVWYGYVEIFVVISLTFTMGFRIREFDIS